MLEVNCLGNRNLMFGNRRDPERTVQGIRSGRINLETGQARSNGEMRNLGLEPDDEALDDLEDSDEKNENETAEGPLKLENVEDDEAGAQRKVKVEAENEDDHQVLSSLRRLKISKSEKP